MECRGGSEVPVQFERPPRSLSKARDPLEILQQTVGFAQVRKRLVCYLALAAPLGRQC